MERNFTLDYFKVFLSILVITIHIGPLSATYPLLNWLISQGIARIAVPCFFVINGYYLAKKIDNSKALKKYIRHLLIIYAVWSAFYILLNIDQPPITASLFLEYITLGILHLWYVIALVYGTLLLYIAKKFIKNDTVLLVLAILFFSIGVFCEPLREGNIHIVRNGFFVGFPFIFLGYYIHTQNLIFKSRDTTLVALIVLSLITLCIESSCARDMCLVRDTYLSLIVCCPALIIFVFKHSSYRIPNTYLTYLGSLGSAIYFIHYFVIIKLWDISMPYTIIRFGVILFLSIILSVFIIYINKRIKIFL